MHTETNDNKQTLVSRLQCCRHRACCHETGKVGEECKGGAGKEVLGLKFSAARARDLHNLAELGSAAWTPGIWVQRPAAGRRTSGRGGWDEIWWYPYGGPGPEAVRGTDGGGGMWVKGVKSEGLRSETNKKTGRLTRTSLTKEMGQTVPSVICVILAILSV